MLGLQLSYERCAFDLRLLTGGEGFYGCRFGGDFVFAQEDDVAG
jgi:hypothetical protein